jgi:hypothetical protein
MNLREVEWNWREGVFGGWISLVLAWEGGDY